MKITISKFFDFNADEVEIMVRRYLKSKNQECHGEMAVNNPPSDGGLSVEFVSDYETQEVAR